MKGQGKESKSQARAGLFPFSIHHPFDLPLPPPPKGLRDYLSNPRISQDGKYRKGCAHMVEQEPPFRGGIGPSHSHSLSILLRMP